MEARPRRLDDRHQFESRQSPSRRPVSEFPKSTPDSEDSWRLNAASARLGSAETSSTRWSPCSVCHDGTGKVHPLAGGKGGTVPSGELYETVFRKTDRYPRPFDVLHYVQFLWPKGRKALTPRELANLIGCHPSIIVKAINQYSPSLGRRRSPHRWEISRNRWQNIFVFSRTMEPRLPPLPRQRFFSTTEAMEVLQRWGLRDISVHRVRHMIRCGELQGLARPTGKRKWHVTRRSMEKIQKSLLTE